MRIAIHLSNQLIGEALSQLLVTNGYDAVIIGDGSCANGSAPDVLLVDTATLSHDLRATYPEAKVLLIDTGTEPERLPATLLTYRIHGVLSPQTEIQRFKKALQAVSTGQVWIDHALVTAVLHDTGAKTKAQRINGTTARERQIIAYVHQGLTNKEIARKLALCAGTVKAHLHRIFLKLNVTSRSKLAVLAFDRLPTLPL